MKVRPVAVNGVYLEEKSIRERDGAGVVYYYMAWKKVRPKDQQEVDCVPSHFG